MVDAASIAELEKHNPVHSQHNKEVVVHHQPLYKDASWNHIVVFIAYYSSSQ